MFVMTVIAGSPTARAQDVPKAIRFAPGSTGAVVEGSVIRGERHAYTLRAGKGQWLEISISALEKNAVFDVFLPGATRSADGSVVGTPLAGATEMERFSGQLPAAGPYLIVVGGTRGNASYRLNVSVTAARAEPNTTEFRLVTDTGAEAVYVAPTTISKNGSRVTAWVLQNFPTPASPSRAKSKIGSVVVDCDAKDIREGVASLWSEQNATGESAGTVPAQPPTAVVDGSPTQQIHALLCRPLAQTRAGLDEAEKAAQHRSIVARVEVHRSALP